ncbi:MAG TPA: hypothetical protein VK576_00240 [Thermoleophilia bacterium]|nr:hypothetical protein [Thermoleophilia bacterium]
MNGMVEVVGAAVHRAVIHGRGVPVPVHTGGTLSTSGALLVVLILGAALAVGIIGWRLDRRGMRAATRKVATDGRHVGEWDVRQQPRKPAAAAPLQPRTVGVLQRRRSPERRDERDRLL